MIVVHAFACSLVGTISKRLQSVRVARDIKLCMYRHIQDVAFLLSVD